jgi:hypothetical protein
MSMNPRRLTRRQAIQFLASLGITGPLALEVIAQTRENVSQETLRAASALIDQNFGEERLKAVAVSVQRNLDQFQIVRDLELDDLLEPAPIFNAKAKG